MEKLTDESEGSPLSSSTIESDVFENSPQLPTFNSEELSTEMIKFSSDDDPDFVPTKEEILRTEIEDKKLEIRMNLEEELEKLKELEEEEEELENLKTARGRQMSKAAASSSRMQTRSSSRAKKDDAGYEKFVAGMNAPAKKTARSKSRGRKVSKSRSNSRARSQTRQKAAKKATRGRSKSRGTSRGRKASKSRSKSRQKGPTKATRRRSKSKNRKK